MPKKKRGGDIPDFVPEKLVVDVNPADGNSVKAAIDKIVEYINKFC